LGLQLAYQAPSVVRLPLASISAEGHRAALVGEPQNQEYLFTYDRASSFGSSLSMIPVHRQPGENQYIRADFGWRKAPLKGKSGANPALSP